MEPCRIIALGTQLVLLIAVVTDLRSRTIPDVLPLALVLLAAMASWRGWHALTWSDLGIGLGVGFAIGAALFYLGAMGGGDAKLCAGLGAVCGLPRLLEVLFTTALWGGVLSLLAKRRGQKSLPYAPAFALGYAVNLAIDWTMTPATGLWTLITGWSL
jgi:Flp pilus assembly protein protease CpaA